MIILNKENGSTGSFYIKENGKELAEIVYRKEKDKIVIEHTEVDESLRGKNIGFDLVEKTVEYAREQRLKVQPDCKFAEKIIERHQQFHDVLYVS
ncbi:MAG: acyl-CoA acyltransferase [Segetibacter sp.]|nr:acyl-CoA acyltransferase [Segetibacter sp.]